jgi:hypothetical protein
MNGRITQSIEQSIKSRNDGQDESSAGFNVFRISSLNLVDLAGSENSSKAQTTGVSCHSSAAAIHRCMSIYTVLRVHARVSVCAYLCARVRTRVCWRHSDTRIRAQHVRAAARFALASL